MATTTEPIVTWRPQLGPQAIAIDARYVVDELFLGGGRGGGKSDYLLGDFLADVEQGAAWQGILFRRTYPELDELIRRSQVLYRGAEYKVGRHEWRFPNGATLKFRHIDSVHDAAHYQGHAYTWCGWDELTNFSSLEPYDMLKATLRSAHNVKGMRIRATGNPGGPGHAAVKARFVDVAEPMTPYKDPVTGMTRVYIPARIYDNKKLLEADPRYLDRLKAVGDEALVQAWLEGDWDALVGSYFSIKRREVMVEPFDIPPDFQLAMGMDYGEKNPTSAWLAAVDYDDTVYMVSTYHQADRSASEHAEGILEMIDNCPWTKGRRPSAIYVDPSMFVKRRLTPINEHSPADVFADVGLHLTPANNDRIGGWRICRDALHHQRFKTFEGWTDPWWQTVPALPRDRNNAEDVDTHSDDHQADAWRYGMVHIYKPYRVDKPQLAGTGQELINEMAAMVRGGRNRYGGD